jgi:hypothetical protein
LYTNKWLAVFEKQVVIAALQLEQPILYKEFTMIKYPLALSALSATLLLSTGLLCAAEQTKAQDMTQEQTQIYGSQIMTQQERIEYRDKMRAARTTQEQEKVRKEHHELMKERAKEKGISLPDEPPARGGGMGTGGGMMGPGGGGMGPGGGRGR